MPCRGPDDDEPRVSKYAYDKIYRENCLMRESLLKVQKYSPSTFRACVNAEIQGSIETEQVKHRQEDLNRLEQLFVKSKDVERLQKVWAANPNLPLARQLGFNPDDI